MNFDPYRKWLGIPSNRRPPTYYDLLGITAGEKDADVIRSAIDQRRMYIRSKKGDGQDAHVKAILGLIEEATSTLLVPEFKHGYDRQLGLHLKKGGSRRSYILPSWMESRVVRVYGEGSGIVGDLLGIVSILLAAFGLMAWWSFTLQKQELTSNDSNEMTWMEKAVVGEAKNDMTTPTEPAKIAEKSTKPIQSDSATEIDANVPIQLAGTNDSTNLSNDKDIAKVTTQVESQSLEENENLIGSTLFRGHRYKVFPEAGLDWMTAKSRCEAMGGHLVTISDEQENQFMFALATKTLGDINNTGIWLGATDERNEGQWEWLDGTPFKYSNWNEGSPNGKNKENHLLLLLYFRGPAGKEVRGWADQPMAGKIHVIYYACEWDDLSESAITSNDRNANTQKTENKTSYSIVGLWQSTDGTESKTFSSDGTFVEMNRAGKVFNSGKWQKDGRNIFQGKLKNGYSINIEMTTSAEAKFTVFNQQNSFVEKKQMIRVPSNSYLR